MKEFLPYQELFLKSLMNSLQFFANKRRADTGLLHAILKSFSPSPIPSALGIHLEKLCPPGESVRGNWLFRNAYSEKNPRVNSFFFLHSAKEDPFVKQLTWEYDSWSQWSLNKLDFQLFTTSIQYKLPHSPFLGKKKWIDFYNCCYKLCLNLII